MLLLQVRDWITAAKTADLSLLQLLLERTPRLLWAVAQGHTALGHTALHWAAARGGVAGAAAVTWLLEKGLPPGVLNAQVGAAQHSQCFIVTIIPVIRLETGRDGFS